MKTIDLEQGSQEWLEFRRMKVGASEAPIVMGVSPWSTPRKLWRQKMELDPVTFNSYVMRRGTELEPVARALYESGVGVKCPPAVVQHDDHDFMIASLDGLSECGEFCVEIKCGGEKLFRDCESGIIPDYYECQIQHQLAVTGRDSIDYFVFWNGETSGITVGRDDKFIEKMIKKEREFMQSVYEFDCPGLSNGDYEKRDDSAWLCLAAELRGIRSQVSDLKAREEVIIQQLTVESKEKPSEGGGIRFAKRTRAGTVDYKSIPELKDVDLEPYRKKPSVYYQATVIKDV